MQIDGPAGGKIPLVSGDRLWCYPGVQPSEAQGPAVNHRLLRWSAHVGLCVEYPSLSWLAPTPQEALEGIRQVVAEVVADMEANEETVPGPIALRHCSGKVTVRIPPDLHRRLALEAAESGISLNRLASAKLSQ